MGLVSSYRYDKEVVDSVVAILEADKMREAIETKHLDRDDFLWILSTRNVFQLKATFQYYKQKYGNSIYQVQFSFTAYQLAHIDGCFPCSVSFLIDVV